MAGYDDVARILKLDALPKDEQRSFKDDYDEILSEYRTLARSVPSHLKGAPFPHMTLSKRHEWVDSHLLNPIAKLREALAEDNRPLMSTWPDLGTPEPANKTLLLQELDRLETTAKYLWTNIRLRRHANVKPGWEIIYEAVRKLAHLFEERLGLVPTRGTHNADQGATFDTFPNAMTYAIQHIFSDANLQSDHFLRTLLESKSDRQES